MRKWAPSREIAIASNIKCKSCLCERLIPCDPQVPPKGNCCADGCNSTWSKRYICKGIHYCTAPVAKDGEELKKYQ